MTLLASALLLLVAVQHIGFLVLEMFLWTRPAGRRVFKTTAEFAEASKVLAANQGLYNGFLAAGLLWSLWQGAVPTQLFFLGCVIVAGVYGGITVKRSILFVQALPAALALLARLLA